MLNMFDHVLFDIQGCVGVISSSSGGSDLSAEDYLVVVAASWRICWDGPGCHLFNGASLAAADYVCDSGFM